MATRILVFPVMGRRWAFSSLLSSGGGLGQAQGPSLHPGTVKELLQALRKSPSTSGQADLLTDFVSDKMHATFHAWEAAPDGSIRRKMHRIGQRMLSRLGPTESFLKAIPKDATLLEIVYPNFVNPRLVRRRVRHLASSAEVFHRRYMYGSIALLPLSAIMGILPLPNVVLAWNLFRAYSHWRALEGSRRLHSLVTDSPSKVSVSRPQNEVGPEMEASTSSESLLLEAEVKTNQLNQWVFLPSEVLDRWLAAANVPREAISDVTVAEICKEYSLDPQEIVKWRDQRLPITSLE